MVRHGKTHGVLRDFLRLEDEIYDRQSRGGKLDHDEFVLDIEKERDVKKKNERCVSNNK